MATATQPVVPGSTEWLRMMGYPDTMSGGAGAQQSFPAVPQYGPNTNPQLSLPAQNQPLGLQNPGSIQDYSTPYAKAKIDSSVGYTPSTQKQDNSGLVSGLANVAGSALMSIDQTNKNQAMADYQGKAQTAGEMDKYWFDPNRDVEPKLDEYLKTHPSATETLDKSRNATLSDVFDPGTNALASIFDAAGNKELAKQTHYAAYTGSEDALQGAEAGLALGPVGAVAGAIIGGVIGIVQGFFAYGSASDADKKRTEDFARQYKIWDEKRKKRITQSRLALIDQTAKASELERTTEQQNKLNANRSKKETMMDLIKMATVQQKQSVVPQRG